MRKLVAAAMAVMCLAIGVKPAGAICTVLPANGMNLLVPMYGDGGDVWAKCLKYDFTVLGSSAVVGGGSVGQPLYMPASALVYTSTWSPAGFFEYYGIRAATGAFTGAVSAGSFVGPLTGNVTGNAATATALASAGTLAGSGYLSRGVDASGNAQMAFVETNSGGVSGSTNPWSAGAAFTALASKQATGNYLTGLTGDVAATGPGSVSATIQAGAVTASKIANNTITNSQVASGAFSNVTGVGAQAQALNMNTHQVNNVTDPTSAQDAATKNYVDSNATVLDYKAPVRLGTTAALPSNSYSNGSSGVGATITGLSIGQISIDGAVANVGDRVLVMNEATSANNGIYTVTANSSIVVFVLTRATDHDQPVEMSSGTLVVVTSGTVNGGTGVAGTGGTQPSTFLQSTAVSVVGTSPVAFVETSGLGEITAGTGLAKSGNTISLSPVGITSACASGFHLSTFTVANGIVTGGGCIADGSGGISSMQIASGTVSGGNIGTAAGPLLTATSFYLDSAGLTLTQSGNAAIIGVKNITALATATSSPGGTSATLVLSVCLPNSTATWNSGNNPALLCYAGSGNTSATADGQAAIILDGVIVSSVSARAAIAQANLSQCVVTATLAAGSHSACLATATNDGSSMVVPGGSSSKAGSKLSVVEINTSGSGYSAPGSSVTFIPGTTVTENIFSVAVASVTTTTRGCPVRVWASGDITSSLGTGADVGVSFIQDSGFVSPLTALIGVKYTAGGGSCTGSDCWIGTWEYEYTPAAGTHTWGLTMRSQSGTMKYENGANNIGQFGVQEKCNAAGTGDVSSNGNNGFSGNNTHSGTEAFNSTATFNVSPSSNTAPTANALYSMFIPKMAAIFDQSTSSVTTYGAINVTSATWVGTGVVRFNLVTPMSVHHMCICSARNLNVGTASTVCNPNYKPNGTSVEIINESVTPAVSNFTNGGIVQCWDYGSTVQ